MGYVKELLVLLSTRANHTAEPPSRFARSTGIQNIIYNRSWDFYYRSIDCLSQGVKTRDQLVEEISTDLQLLDNCELSVREDQRAVDLTEFIGEGTDVQFSSRSLSIILEKIRAEFSIIAAELNSYIRRNFLELSDLGLEGDPKLVTEEIHGKLEGDIVDLSQMFRWKSTPQGATYWAELLLGKRDEVFRQELSVLLRRINSNLGARKQKLKIQW